MTLRSIAMIVSALFVSFVIHAQPAKSAAAANHAMASKESIVAIEASIRSQAYDQALQQASAALTGAPKDYRLWTLKGIVFSIQGNDQESLRAFDRALAMAPDYSAALKGEVQIYAKTQDKRAIPLLERILKTEPKDETAHEMLALMEQTQGDCAAADEHFGFIVDAIEKHPRSLAAYGSCLVQTGHPEKAVPVFQQLVAALPEQTFAKYDLAVVLVETKQNQAAIDTLEPLLTAGNADPDLLSLAADAYEASGNTPKAVALQRQAIVLDPRNAAYYTSFAAICLDHDSFQVGVDMIDAGLKYISNDPSLYLSRGLLYAQMAQYDKAEADFKTAERLDAKQSISAYALDLAELEKNNSEGALAQIRAQLKLHPESALLHYLLAKQLSSQMSNSSAEAASKVSDEAQQAALQAVKLKPDMTEARDLLATMYTDSAQYGLAIEQCRLALQTNPGDQTAIYHLIVALRHAGSEEQRAEIPALVKRLAELQKVSRQQETDRKRFKLEVQSAPPRP
jgi:tetratricopeptide (TPR) repeat protein